MRDIALAGDGVERESRDCQGEKGTLKERLFDARSIARWEECC
jgi:hypothetical protein